MCAWLGFPIGAAALSLGQIDDFEDGSTAGWSAGAPHPAPPSNVATGGSAGAEDSYLLLRSIGGSTAGSRLSAFNKAQWTGDYLDAGVTAIAMDVTNLGASALSLRLAIGSSSSAAMSSQGIPVPAMSGWTSIVFPIAPSDLIVLAGNAQAALSSSIELRLLHVTSTTYPGTPVVASLGVDNIRAVPEPSSLALVGIGLLVLLRARRRARPAWRRPC